MASLSGLQGAGSKANPPGESAKEQYLGDAGGGDTGDKAGKHTESSTPSSSTETTRTSDPLKGVGSADVEDTSGVGDPKNETERSFVEGTKKGDRLVS
ncbi:hypothetical protein A1O1_06941 [Capronia coronata CBS 617.96]|uniref:Uncharacterized protein n=1 Tax=Capronia coronata CBS 617.96 TaxID=1182541 RepID=W9Y103_9EURO|nr:uncharacterized protein A1O1_06941 [Capronia coronata CBS 617.96]EXJ83320.1 hypothetical protein A1O1_06941 [Capronia coronata CBS 617.96]